jgi:3-hydroxyacyl-CoA dehydrogenase
MAIERAAVLGAGVMGSGIAAQIANAGVPVPRGRTIATRSRAGPWCAC